MVVFTQPKKEVPKSPIPSGAPRIKVIGIGAGGIHFVNVMIVEGVRGCKFVSIDTDVSSLKQSLASKNILIGPNLRLGSGTGCDPCLGRKAVLESRELLIEEFQNDQFIVLVGGLGGGVATGATTHIVQFAREAGVSLVMGLFTLPGHRESKFRHQYAMRALPMLESSLDTTILFSNDRLLRDPSTMSNSHFADRGAESIASAFKGVIDILFQCGPLRVDFADLCNCLDSHGYGSLSVGIASGPNRAMEATRGALNSPLVQASFLEQSETILIQMQVGTDMPLKSINRAMSLISAQYGDDKRIELSLNQKSAYKGLARCTLLASCARRSDAKLPILI